jgi:hypothetical protein
MDILNTLSQEELIKLLKVFAKNWLAHDGCWFIAAEEKYGLDIAMELDTKAWELFAVAEARRIVNEFKIPKNGGLKSLEKAFQFRLYSVINKQEVEWIDEKTMRFIMIECRVQKLRRQKNLPDFPCKFVGEVEFSQFARTVDPRIKTKCMSCPPDAVKEFYCGWEFTLDG